MNDVKKQIKQVINFHEVDPATDDQFGCGHYTYTSAHRTKAFLEALFRTEIMRAYTNDTTVNPNGGVLSWGATHLILYFRDGGVVKLNNSEWAFFEEVRDRSRVSKPQ